MLFKNISCRQNLASTLQCSARRMTAEAESEKDSACPHDMTAIQRHGPPKLAHYHRIGFSIVIRLGWFSRDSAPANTFT